MPPSDPHSDPIVRDLRAIPRLKWSRPEQFGRLEILLTHPLIGHFAFQPKKEPQRVRTLRSALREVVKRIREKEGDDPPQGRSVADAATALLRLSDDFAQMPLEEIRSHVVDVWGVGRGGSKLTVDGFRLHVEVPQVFEPVAAEFRAFAALQAEDYLPRGGSGELESRDEKPDEGDVADIDPVMSVEEALQIVQRERFVDHRKEIADGMVWIRSEDEMLKVLLAVTKVAKSEFIAVDYVDVSEWFASPQLHLYLMTQLERVGPELTLTRIRVVRDEELQFGSRRREQLEELIRLHDRTDGANLLLCHEEALTKLMKKVELRFAPHVGLIMIDPDSEPAAVTGRLSGDGAIGQARAYRGSHPDLWEYQREFEILKQLAEEQDQVVRDRLGLAR